MTIEINANVLAQPREPFWMDEYPEAYVYAGYNAGDHDNKYHTGGQTVVNQTLLDMEVRANIQRVYSVGKIGTISARKSLWHGIGKLLTR